MTSYFEYIVTSLDMHSIDLEDFKFGGTNITAFRLVDPHNPEVVEVRSYTFYIKYREGLSTFSGCPFLDPRREKISIKSIQESRPFYKGRDGLDI